MRKQICGRVAVVTVLCMAMTLLGCTTAWVGQAEEIVAALIPAATNVVALVAALDGKGVSTTDLQLIQNAGAQAGSDLQLIQSLITAYQSADATAKPGILAKIQSAVLATQSSLQGLLPALHIEDVSTQAKVTAVVGIVLSEVQSLAALVPLVTSPEAPTLSQKARKSGPPSAVKMPLSASEFVASYNATLTAKTGNSNLDRAAAGLRIHSHGKLARWGSLGVVK